MGQNAQALTVQKADEADRLYRDRLKFDAAGAQEAGVACLAVTYGFGFQTPEERAHPAVVLTADTPADIVRQLLPAGGQKA